MSAIHAKKLPRFACDSDFDPIPSDEELEARYADATRAIEDEEIDEEFAYAEDADDDAIDRLADLLMHDAEPDELETTVKDPPARPLPICGDHAWEWDDPMRLALKTARRFGTSR